MGSLELFVVIKYIFNIIIELRTYLLLIVLTQGKKWVESKF